MLSGGGPTEGTIARVTPLADGGTVYVGGVELTGSAESPVYATTDDSGNESNYNIKWDGSTLTLKNAYINGGCVTLPAILQGQALACLI